jgi:predicted DNA-binding transcriptional regulator AlpA
MARRILREPEACARLGVKRTKFRLDYKFVDESDPFIPGTEIPRIKSLALGPTLVGFAETELDRVIDALVEIGGHSESKGTRATSAAQRRKRK